MHGQREKNVKSENVFEPLLHWVLSHQSAAPIKGQREGPADEFEWL